MNKKQSTWLLIISLLFVFLGQLGQGNAQFATTTLSGWQVETIGVGTYCSESNGVFNLGTHGGPDCPSIALYKEIHPTGDFNFSLQVKANINESCAICVRGQLPMRESRLSGFNLEYGYFGSPVFLCARTVENWTFDEFVYSSAYEWYTLQVSVYASPFKVTMSVFAENGSSLGIYSTSDMTNFRFEDIKYIGFYTWGYSPGDYLFRNIQSSFDNLPNSSINHLSINTESTSTNAGATVNIFGKLADSNNNPLPDKTIVLSYNFAGVDAWIPVSSAQTDQEGNYNIQWINSASGTFTLNASWSGDAANAFVSNVTTLSFLPSEKSTFVIESNSTVNQLTFDNNTSTLSFDVTGPSGTEGFVKTTIAKNLLTNSTALQAYLDGQPLDYAVASMGDYGYLRLIIRTVPIR